MSATDAKTQEAAAQDVTSAVRAVAALIGAPDFILPWLDRFYDADDADLLLAAGGGSLGGASEERLARAVRRAVLDVDDAGVHSPADFHERLEIWAMFEGWKDVPLAIHRQLADWDVDHYAEKIREDVEAVRDGHPGDSYEARYSYVLLDEAEAIVAAQDHIYLWPCDCRSIVSKCRKLKDVCLRFEQRSRSRLGDLQGARRRDPARHRQGRPHAHGGRAGRRGAHVVDLQLLHRLLLPAPRLGAARGERGVARAPLRRAHRHGPLQELRTLRPALPVRGHRVQLRRPAGVRRRPLSRLRAVRDGLQRGRHRTSAAHRGVARWTTIPSTTSSS